MRTIIEISDLSYHICKRFRIHIPDLFNYLIKTIGDHKPKGDKKIKDGKRHYKRTRKAITHHLHRKNKVKSKQTHHETAESL